MDNNAPYPAQDEVHLTIPNYDMVGTRSAPEEWPPEKTNLLVPDEFRDFQKNGGHSGPQTPEQRELLELSIKSFVRSFFHGVHLDLLLNDGLSVVVECSMDLNMSSFVVRGQRTQKEIALGTVKSVRAPLTDTECKKTPVKTVDGRCGVLILVGGEFLTFRFDTEEACVFFGVCMKVLIKASRNNAKPGKTG